MAFQSLDLTEWKSPTHSRPWCRHVPRAIRKWRMPEWLELGGEVETGRSAENSAQDSVCDCGVVTGKVPSDRTSERSSREGCTAYVHLLLLISPVYSQAALGTRTNHFSLFTVSKANVPLE